MKALPKRLSENWQVAKCDPDGNVEYLIIPLTNDAMMQVTSMHTKGREVDAISMAYDILRLTLRGLRGLEDPDADGPFELEYNTVKIGGKEYERVNRASLNRLPATLFGELLRAANEAHGLTGQEAEELGFTATSSEETSTSAEPVN